jgi:hypothetical protein
MGAWGDDVRVCVWGGGVISSTERVKLETVVFCFVFVVTIVLLDCGAARVYASRCVLSVSACLQCPAALMSCQHQISHSRHQADMYVLLLLLL